MKQKKSTRVFASLAVAGAVLGVAGKANASGFYLHEQSVKHSGTAIAGGAASAEDAATIYFNPAGMTRLHGRQVSLAGHLIVPVTTFSGSATTNPTLPVGGGSTISGGDGGDPGSLKLVPNFYYVHELNERMWAGLGIGVPFGNSIEYDSDWVGRYHNISVELMTVNFNPSMAYKINDKLSLGAGVDIMYADFEDVLAVDYSAACLDNADEYGLICSALGLNTPGDPRTDGKVDVTATGWGFGINFGLLYELSEGTRIGLAYRSPIDLNLEGAANFTAPLGDPNILGLWPMVPAQLNEVLRDTDISMVKNLPPSLSLSLLTRVAPKWDLLTDVTWTKWSVFPELQIEFDNPKKEDSIQPLNHKDTYRVSLGFNYHYNTKWDWRGGIAYDKTPIPNAESRTPRIPGNDRKWLAGGLTYRFSPAMTADFALVHLFTAETEINTLDPHHGHNLSGTYDANINIISSQVSWQF